MQRYLKLQKVIMNGLVHVEGSDTFVNLVRSGRKS